MAVNPTSRVQKALDKASALGGSARVRWMSGGFRSVRGEHGKYRVNVRVWSCTCPAGQRDLPCYHKGCAFMAQIRDQAGSSRVN